MSDRALTVAVGEHVNDDDEPDQLALFGAPLTVDGQALAVVKKVGPGRPPGARNKRTERSVAWLLQRHRDPREVLLEIAEANVYDLAARLECSPAEAMTEKRLAAIGVLPYVAAKITPEIIDNRQVIHLTIGGFGGLETGAAAGPVQVLDPSEFAAVAEGTSAIPDGDRRANAGDAFDLPAPSPAPSHEPSPK